MTAARRILVTGATGFIGRHALAPLRDLGFEVHAVARAIPGAPPEDAAARAGVQWHEADLLAPGAARALIQAARPTHLLHFAWYAEHGKFWDSPRNLDWLAATLALLRDFAEAGGERFVGAGTCAEYDWSGTAQENRFDEGSTPLRPSHLYGAAKASAFLTGSLLAKNAGVAFAWGRIFHLFGPGEPAARIVPALIRAHLLGEKLDCGSGTQARDFLPASAIGDAFARLCASDVRGAVNIGSGRETRLTELSAILSGLIGNQGDVRFGALAGATPERLVPLIRRLTAEVGWTPPETLEEGLRKTVEWWKSRARETRRD
jgi:nucleoside-diphosphate-sugar epimerase